MAESVVGPLFRHFALAMVFAACIPTTVFAQEWIEATSPTSPTFSTGATSFEIPDADPAPLPFAGGSGDALYICCAAGYCTYSAIDDCSLLSDSAKVVALSVAGISGVLGFALGFAGGSLLLAKNDVYALTPFGGIDLADNAESVVALGFLGGAVGVLVGGVVGLFAGLITTPFFDEVSVWRPAQRRTAPVPRREGAPPRMHISQLVFEE